MANELAASFTLTGDLTLTKEDALAPLTAALSVGSNDFPEIAHEWINGTGDGQANEAYSGTLTIPAGSGLSLDLNGNSTYKNPVGDTLAFVSVRLFLAVLTDPTSGRKVTVGPQNVSNTAQLWFTGVGADAGEEVYDFVLRHRLTGGWTITAGTGDLVRFLNPGASDVDVAVLILGTK